MSSAPAARHLANTAASSIASATCSGVTRSRMTWWTTSGLPGSTWVPVSMGGERPLQIRRLSGFEARALPEAEDVDIEINNADLRVDDTTVTNDGDDLAYGVGASYAFTRELLAVAEWETINSHNPELSMLSLGFLFKFR